MNMSYVTNDTLKVTPDKHIELIGSALGLEIAGGLNSAAAAITNKDCDKYAFYFVKTRSDMSHHRNVQCIFDEQDETLGDVIPPIYAIDDSSSRSYTDWLPIMGRRVRVNIRNFDTESHTYDVYLYGVR